MSGRSTQLGLAVAVARALRSLASPALIGLCVGGVFALGCPLPRGLSCGDGWLDPEFEQCDPNDPNQRHASACRDKGFTRDAGCDPLTCEILDSDDDCNICGDGVVRGDEECDGSVPDSDAIDLQCALGFVSCNSSCRLECVGECVGRPPGDLTPECTPNEQCEGDDDCEEGEACSSFLEQCLPALGGFSPELECSNFEPEHDEKDSYTKGYILHCTDACIFSRENCSYCGDGVLDGEFDITIGGDEGVGTLEPEVCDGDQVDRDKLIAHCQPLCIEEGFPFDPALPVFCDVECNEDCDGFVIDGDVIPGGSASDYGCCLAGGTPCPTEGYPGIPDDLPCCQWLDNPPEAEDTCVLDTENAAIQICPA
ncbi:hypothetical protein PPSIR1_35897 [Plesiocystis pacifica SIR-1]|uniref:Uncharacterized protein n=1 Tax=Plesiocystis pacifica SIR-1 TaxID=391625 RepID=A6G1V8_9BACT|nr:hypothetical protein [Plesiocystis pacifica]EDM80148.1 hypothetical protein PPSIR1_35897 [Plesiocystis pacifica SIR-1]